MGRTTYYDSSGIRIIKAILIIVEVAMFVVMIQMAPYILTRPVGHHIIAHHIIAAHQALR